MPKIAVCGCAGVDKPSFVNEFLKQFTIYRRGCESYKNIPQKKQVFGSQELQLSILNAMVDDILALNKTDNVIIEHSILDNLVDSMWMNVHLTPQKISNIDDRFIQKSIKVVKETLHFLDLIIWLPKVNQYDIQYASKEDEVYDDEIDNLFSAIEETYTTRKEQIFEFSSPDGAPGLIQVFGTPEERMNIIKLYLDPKTGDFLGKVDSDSLIQLPSDLESQVLLDTITKQISASKE